MQRTPNITFQKNFSYIFIKEPFNILEHQEYTPKQNIISGQSSKEIGSFPYNIAQYIWAHQGKYSEEDFLFLGELLSGSYIFFKAKCGKNGFCDEPFMEYWISDVPSTIIMEVMSDKEYEIYRKETS